MDYMHILPFDLIRMHNVTPPLPYYVGSRCMVAAVTAVHVGVTVPGKSE